MRNVVRPLFETESFAMFFLGAIKTWPRNFLSLSLSPGGLICRKLEDAKEAKRTQPQRPLAGPRSVDMRRLSIPRPPRCIRCALTTGLGD